MITEVYKISQSKKTITNKYVWHGQEKVTQYSLFVYFNQTYINQSLLPQYTLYTHVFSERINYVSFLYCVCMYV